MRQPRLTPAEAILCALFPVVAMGLLNGFYKEALIADWPALFWLQDVATFVILPLCGVLLLGRGVGLWPRHYGFTPANLWRAPGRLVLLTACAIALAALCYAYGLDLGLVLWPAAEIASRFDTLLPGAFLPRLLVVGYLSISAALVEEAVFRALPWACVERRLSRPRRLPVYLCATALVFGFIHAEQGLHAVFATTLLGFAWALFYARTQNLWALVVAHFAIDMWSFWA